ncbi:hypothetical protein L0F63_005894, partial [Massospora cicadina]
GIDHSQHLFISGDGFKCEPKDTASREASVIPETGDTRPRVNIDPAVAPNVSFTTPFGSLMYSSYYSAQLETSKLRLNSNIADGKFPSKDELVASLTLTGLHEAEHQAKPTSQDKVVEPKVLASAVEPDNPKVETKFMSGHSNFERSLFTFTSFASLTFLFCLSISNYPETSRINLLTPRNLLVELHSEDLRLSGEVGPRKIDAMSSEINRALSLGPPIERGASGDRGSSYRTIFSDVAQEISEDRGLLGLLGGIKAYQTSPVELPKEPKLASGDSPVGSTLTRNKAHPPPSAVYKTRVWLANRVLAPIVASAQRVDSALKEQKLGTLVTGEPSYFYDHAPKPGIKLGSSPRNLLELYQSNPESATVADRLRIERYINVPLYQARQYVIRRLTGTQVLDCSSSLPSPIELASHGFISNFCWDGGSAGRWNYGAGQSALPTDAELLAHLFVTFMDLATPSALGVDATRFSTSHYLERGAPMGGGKVFELPKGGDNVFLAIYVFALLVMRDHSGGIPLHAPEIGLDALVR